MGRYGGGGGGRGCSFPSIMFSRPFIRTDHDSFTQMAAAAEVEVDTAVVVAIPMEEAKEVEIMDGEHKFNTRCCLFHSYDFATCRSSIRLRLIRIGLQTAQSRRSSVPTIYRHARTSMSFLANFRSPCNTTGFSPSIDLSFFWQY